MTTSLHGKSKCYSELEVQKIAEAITELEKCENELFLKNAFIENRINAKEPAHLAWWQDPVVIVGGISISIGLTAAVTTYILVGK